MDSKPDPSDAEELAQLARALSGQVRRTRARGQRGSRKTPNAAPASSARAPAPAVERAAAAVERATPVAAASARAAVTAARAPAARETSVPPASATAKPAAGGVRAAAERVRAVAAACNTLEELRAAVAQCTECGLCRTRTQTVFQDGKGTRGVLFVGEAPGADEDRTGVPFVGRAGQLLTDIITKGMGIARDDVWIANVLKCRPPDNREPTADEKATCTPFLDRQVELMQPRVIIPLGKHAALHVLGIESSTMGAMRGKVHTRGGRPVIPTFHPAYLLRSPGEKKECWKDIQLAMREIGLAVDPARAPTGAKQPDAAG